MAAWKHVNFWNEGFYKMYRQDAAKDAPSLEGTKDVDCADLSITALVDFAEKHFLPVTFLDASGFLYCSKANIPWGMLNHTRRNLFWYSKSMFLGVVRTFIQVKSLYGFNTTENGSGPEPGDLLMRYKEWPVIGKVRLHHTALVFAAYPPGTPSSQASNMTIPNFPGDDQAMKDSQGTKYFRGTVDKDGKTANRLPDSDAHFDYLNSRGDDKRNAELIYYANARQFADDDFEFRIYAPRVLDNWGDWKNPNGPPPRGLGMRSFFSDSKSNEPNDNDAAWVQEKIVDS